MNKHVKVAHYLATILDNQFGIGNFRFGVGSLINLVPGVGDIVSATLSFYIIFIAFRIRIPLLIIFQMVGNIWLHFLIGLIPIFGDAYYVIRKVNIKNAALLQKYAA